MTRADQAGISLIEMLVVLAIVGILASATMLAVGAATRGASPESEARRLAARIELAMDEALVTDVPITLMWDDTGYEFLTSAGEGQAVVGAGVLGGRHELPGGLHMESNTQARQLRIAPDGDGDAAMIGISDDDAPWHIRIDGFSAVPSAGKAA